MAGEQGGANCPYEQRRTARDLHQRKYTHRPVLRPIPQSLPAKGQSQRHMRSGQQQEPDGRVCGVESILCGREAGAGSRERADGGGFGVGKFAVSGAYAMMCEVSRECEWAYSLVSRQREYGSNAFTRLLRMFDDHTLCRNMNALLSRTTCDHSLQLINAKHALFGGRDARYKT